MLYLAFTIVKIQKIKKYYNSLNTKAPQKLKIPLIVNMVENLIFVQVNKEIHTILIKYKAIEYFQTKK